MISYSRLFLRYIDTETKLCYIFNVNRFPITIAFLLFTLCASSEAKMVRYVDEQGKVHYVNTNFSKVPERYREQVEPKKTSTESPESPKENNPIDNPPSPPKTTSPSPNNELSTSSPQDYQVEVLVNFDSLDCVKLVNFLESHNISYIPYDIQNSDIGRQKYNQVGKGEIPITIMGNEIVKGYDLKKVYNILVRDKKIKIANPPSSLNKNLPYLNNKNIPKIPSNP